MRRRWWGWVSADRVRRRRHLGLWTVSASSRVAQRGRASSRGRRLASRRSPGSASRCSSDLHVGSPWKRPRQAPPDRRRDERHAARPRAAGRRTTSSRTVLGGTFAPRRPTLRPCSPASMRPLGGVRWSSATTTGTTVRHAAPARSTPPASARSTTTRIAIDGPRGRFWLVGVSDFWEGPHEVQGALSHVTDDAPVIVFTHNPDVFPHVPARVGAHDRRSHAQGWQVAFPFFWASRSCRRATGRPTPSVHVVGTGGTSS